MEAVAPPPRRAVRQQVGHASAIWLGDAVRAIAVLDAGEQTARKIVEMLSLTLPVPRRTIVDQSVTVRDPHRIEQRIVSRPRPSAATNAPAAAQPSLSPATSTALPPIVELEPIMANSSPLQIPMLSEVLPQPPAPLDLPASLLPKMQQRTILSSMSGRVAAVGEIDTDALVEAVAERRPIQSLPRRTRYTTGRGLQLLLDFGEGMRGFERDRDEVAAMIRSVVGVDGLEVLRFATTPVDPFGAGIGPKPTWRRYGAPTGGRPVLLITDLGAGPSGRDRDGAVARWLECSTLWRAAGSPVVALVPLPLERIDRSLRAAVSVVQWDRSSNIRTAVAASRLASRRAPAEARR